jgi:transposase
MEKKYSSDITDEAYNEIKEIIEEKRRGPKGKYTERSKLNALLYLLVNGSSYRNLPRHFPAFRSVFKFKKKLENKGIMDKLIEIGKKKP